MSDKRKTFIALRDTKLRESLSAAFEEDGFDVEWSADGEELAKVLEAMAHHVVLVGSDLDRLSGYDAVYLQRERIQKARRQSAVFLIHSVKHDVELLEHYRSCGVAASFPPDADLDSVVQGVSDVLFEKRRAAPRYRLAAPASVTLPDGRVARGETTDLSESGVGLRLSGDVSLEPGQELSLALSLPTEEYECTVVVKRVAIKSRFFRTTTMVGCEIRPAGPAEESRQEVADVIKALVDLESGVRLASMRPFGF